MEQETARPRTRRLGGLLPWLMLGLASVAAVGVARFGRDGDIDGIAAFEHIGGLHTEADVPYTENPPTGGPHHPIWQNCGVYTDELRDEHVVHSMEHGAVWITYRTEDLSDDDIDELGRRFTGRRYVIVSPRSGQDHAVVLSAWNRQIVVDETDDARIGIFVARYAQGPQAPESGAPCDGGTTETAASTIRENASGNTGGDENPETPAQDDTTGPETEPRAAAQERGEPPQLSGLDEDDARRIAETQGWTWRIEARDGENYVLTQEHDPRRVNVRIENGKVTATRVG